MSSQIPKSHIRLERDIAVYEWLHLVSSKAQKIDPRQFFSLLPRKSTNAWAPKIHSPAVCHVRCLFFSAQGTVAAWWYREWEPGCLSPAQRGGFEKYPPSSHLSLENEHSSHISWCSYHGASYIAVFVTKNRVTWRSFKAEKVHVPSQPR